MHLKDRLLRFWDLVLFIIYFSILITASQTLSTPTISSEFTLMKIFIAGLTGVAAALFLWFTYLHRRSPQKSTLITNFVSIEQIGAIGALCAIALFSTLLVSWTIAIQKHENLLYDNFGMGLRVITTSLHALVPLESRLFQTVIPFILLLPSSKGAVLTKLKVVLWIAFFILSFGIHSKMSALYPLVFLAIYFYSKYGIGTFRRPSFYASVAISFSIIFSTLWSLHTVENPLLKMMAKSNLPSIASTSQQEVEIVQPGVHTKCQFDGGYPTWALNSTPGLIIYRSVGLSSAVTRLFVCLKDHGWTGLYRGHQAARLFGIYIPFYRLAYNEFRSGNGSMINSAVTNVVVDGYFNLGLFGAFFSGLILCLTVVAVDSRLRDTEYSGLMLLCRVNALIVAISGSLPAFLISISPLLLILIIRQRDSRLVA